MSATRLTTSRWPRSSAATSGSHTIRRSTGPNPPRVHGHRAHPNRTPRRSGSAVSVRLRSNRDRQSTLAISRGDRKPGFDHAAAPWYSWMSPPRRSRRRTSRGPTGIRSRASARGGPGRGRDGVARGCRARHRSGASDRDAPTEEPTQASVRTRHWSTYTDVGEWFRDYHGYVPIQMAAGIDRTMRTRGLSFPEAYAFLVNARVVIDVDPVDDNVPTSEP